MASGEGGGDTTGVRATGSCLCGSVRYRVTGHLRDVVVCHCRFCRRASTHVGAYAACAIADLQVEDTRTLRWYRSSPAARRGFCAKCGSVLFWEPASRSHISIAAGSLNEPTGLTITRHVHAAQKGDYYELPQGPHTG